VSGIGPKNAIDLISNYSNFSNIYKNIDKVKQSVRKKLVAGYEGGVLSKQLATIRRDAPVTLNMENCTLPTKQKFTEVFRELNYKSLVTRMTGVKEEKDKSQIGLFD
jgi:DNA polymerase-1